MKIESLKVLIAAVNIRDPLSRLSVIVKIKDP